MAGTGKGRRMIHQAGKADIPFQKQRNYSELLLNFIAFFMAPYKKELSPFNQSPAKSALGHERNSRQQINWKARR